VGVFGGGGWGAGEGITVSGGWEVGLGDRMSVFHLVPPGGEGRGRGAGVFWVKAGLYYEGPKIVLFVMGVRYSRLPPLAIRKGISLTSSIAI
jgi:hypothetical protein